jgi:aryl-alcohol dehydrogenase-like predicted oxidoreductase
MKYRYMGKSGLLVSRVCLGTMTFAAKGWGCDHDAALRIVSSFFAKGGNYIDTADMYSDGVSEEWLGEAVKGLPRDDLVLATKCWFRGKKSPNAKGLSRKHVIEACEASLRRLATDYIDLYQIHGPDPFTPVEETMRALDSLVQAGKVRYIGCSNLYSWQIVKMNSAAASAGLETFISGQYMYNLLRRDAEREVLPACDDQGMGLQCWSPLAGGMLTGKYRGQREPEPASRIGLRSGIDVPRYWNEDSFRVVEEVAAVAREEGKTPSQVALSWLLADRRVTAPILGIRTGEQLEDNCVSGDWDLPEPQRKRLSELAYFNHGYPKDWMDITFRGNYGDEEFAPRHAQRLPSSLDLSRDGT